MKCIKNIMTEKVRRVPNAEAEKLVKTRNWEYIKKTVYKAVVRKI